MTPEQLHQLAALAEARRSRDLAALEAAVAEDRRLAEEIEELGRIPARDFEAGALPLPFAQTALRMAWMDQKIALARKHRADLARRIAHLRKVAAQSLGKHEALKSLTERARHEAAERKLARQEREAPPVKPQQG